MNNDDFDLLLTFVARHGRMLKTRETSFTQKQLDAGRKKIEHAVKAVEKFKFTAEAFSKALDSEKESKNITAEIRKATACTPKQAQFILQKFASFKSAVRQPVVQAIVLDAPKSDRYYSPKPHRYK
ncbi:TPA: hypothetical protein HA318_02425 [Candidatus Micrarchaeota archaeon]|nr:hypothetical protein [Candidatus Micrarchaeota archaeon]